MKRKRKLGSLFISLILVVNLLTVCFYTELSTAADMKSPDLNGDKVVNMSDVILIATVFGAVSGDGKYKSSYDINGDGAINMSDVIIVATSFNKTVNDPTPTNGPTPTQTKKDEPNLTGDIIFSVPSKTFQNQISVTLSTNIANAQIRYTTNGSVPNNSSTLYSSALTFTKTTQLRAQVFVNGAASGKMGTALYIASSINTKHDVPVIIIDDYGAGKPVKDTYKDCAIMVMEPTNNELSLLQTPTIATRGGIHLRGQSSANFEKAPYKIELRDNEDNDAKYKLLGLGTDGDWALLSPYPDKTLIRNSLAYTLGEDMGLQAPGWRHCEVYLNTDNQPLSADDYQGVYLLVETPEIQKNRLDIAKLKPEDITEPNITGGYLMQFNMMAAEAPLIKGNGWSDLELTEPQDANSQQIAWITNYIQKTHNAIHSTNPSNATTGYPAYIDVDSFVNFIITNELAREADSYMRSTRIYKDRDKKLMAGPLWDYDLGYDCFVMGGFGGGFGGGTTSTIEGWQFQPMAMFPGMGGTTCDWYYTLMKDTSFQSKISARWQELRRGPLSNANLSARVKQLSSPLNNAAKRNFQKWNILNTSQIGGFGTQTTQTWEQQLTILENFLLKRAAWLDTSGWKPTTTTNPGGGWGGF
ncbi:CotH kinase family protein [Pseudobacteroides cellulosolvens]|uniref:Spore coat protein CotH n=1 Tax=Pseudobacteroides cellulosolvens ATCC 35603 = DSM 2933 TaxID=398512 RepID=A0A0L6JHT7_9FIRM|nr:CotH kinase family protein [Pseudobacteroides cellulosolvens]KNY25278.1 Spore coat protein CotH [Pseudobacteroides cellulosolvens ATCC 35603 = DSM 2933]